MNIDRCLAVYHFASIYHGGQSSREYRLLSRVSRVFRPSRSEEFVSVLCTPGYEDARAIFVKLVRASGVEGSGYHDCRCCGLPTVCDDAEAMVAMCDDCIEHECDPAEHCNACEESCCAEEEPS